MKAQDLKNSILQMAVQGKLVEQNPADEPASVLLERIREERAELIKQKKIKAPKGGESVIYRKDGSWCERRGKSEPVCIDDEIPFDIPDSWEWARLETVTTYIQRGKSPKYSPIKKYPVVAQKCNQWSGFSIEKAQFIDPDTVEKYADERILREGDLMWNSTGLGTLGRMAIYRSSANPYGWAVADSHVTVIRTQETWLDYQFAFDYFAGPSVQSVIEERASGSTKQKELAQETVKNYLIPIPPLAEQQRIVERVDELMPLVEEYGELEDAREALDAALPERLRKSVLQMAVQGKLVEQDPADEPASVLLERIRGERAELIKQKKVKAPKGGESVIYREGGSWFERRGKSDPVCIDDEIPFDIPESWSWIRLGSLISISSGEGLTSKQMRPGDIPVYGGNGITGYHDRYLIDRETVVIGRVGYYCGSVHVTSKKAWVTDNAFITIYPENCIDRSYLVYVLRNMNLGSSNNATAQPVVSGKKIYPMLFPVAPLKEQERIAHACGLVSTYIQELKL